MKNKKKAPLTPEESKKDQETLDTLARAAILDLANSIHSEWRPYLATEGEMLLGHEVSFDRAVLIQVQKALTTRSETYEQGMKLLHEQNKKIVKLEEKNNRLEEENKKLKVGYQDLCHGYDNLKKLIHDISVIQKGHRGQCDKRFLGIEKTLKNGGF